MTPPSAVANTRAPSSRQNPAHLERGFFVPVASALAVAALFLAYSAVRSPVPGVNEPHYLTKARHFWNSDWCRGDFFLESSNAHWFFYQTVGLLPATLPLENAAWVGRLLALGLLAIAWCLLVRQLTSHPAAPIWSACAFLALQAAGNLSGEWVVGGVEAKVFAYSFALFAAGLALSATNPGISRRGTRIVAAGACAGLAVSFHPVVGLWVALAAVPPLLGFAWSRWRRGERDARSRVWPFIVAAAGAFAVAALPGLVPALTLLGTESPQAAAAADHIQVFERLPHHLDPMAFHAGAWFGYAVLIVGWLWGRRLAERTPAERWFAVFVGASITIALAGLAIGAGPRPPDEMALARFRAWLMKFYPFRLADVLVPAAAAIVLAGIAVRVVRDEAAQIAPGQDDPHRPPEGGHYERSAQRQALAWGSFTGLFVLALVLPAVDRKPSRMPARELADWKDACRWIDARLPQGAEVLTPTSSWAFKWYAQRAEYVSRKDCPQDAAGILEWRRRMKNRNLWLSALYRRYRHRSFPLALASIAERSGVTHAVLKRDPRSPWQPLFANRTFAVYAASPDALSVSFSRNTVQ
ncbi:MAG: hypothetical protein KY476_24150 [Planctomycetes bacterium]|nr:hypothetical protein [Planctomycetota bacterium]